MVGILVGRLDGPFVGDFDVNGVCVGVSEGFSVGFCEGVLVGFGIGEMDG